MKKSRVVLLGVLLMMVAGLGIKFYLDERAREIEAEVVKKREEAALAAAAERAAKLVAQRAMEDTSLVKALPAGYTRPPADWLQNEKAVYEKLLVTKRYDVLVVPFQVMGWSFDQSTRALMTAELSAALAKALNGRLADPYLVAKALGDGERQIRKEAVYRLADLVGAKRVIWGYAGHDRKGHMTLMVTSQTRQDAAPGRNAWGAPEKATKFAQIPMAEDMPPILAFESKLPELIKTLGLEMTGPVYEPIEGRLDLAQLPESPVKLLSTGENPARDAYAFLLYAALTPSKLEHTRNRFAEKAYLSLLRLSPASPEYRALRARTFMLMGFRPAALKALAEPQTPEELALAAALNGNLPDLRAALGKETNSLKRLLQTIDANTIGMAYGLLNAKQSAEAANRLKISSRIWAYLATRAMVDWDDWSQFDNVAPKMILDQDLPMAGYSLADIAQGVASVGDMGKIQAIADQSVNEHARKLLQNDTASYCCDLPTHGPNRLDYLELLQAIGHDNLIRRIAYYSRLQGNNQMALRYANSIDAAYRGHPYYTFELARVKNRMASKVPTAERDLYQKDAYELAFNAMYWEQGQSWIAMAAADEIARSGRSDFGYYGNPYYTDIPFRPYYWTWSDGGMPQPQIDNDVAALKNATYEFKPVERLFGRYRTSTPDDARLIELLKSIEGRFAGSPRKNELLAQEARRQGDEQAAAALYRENIRIAPDYWNSYSVLGKLLFRAGDYQEAARVLKSYPGFKKDSGESRVAVANLSHAAGEYFYWTGHFKLAESFYRITLAQGSGAEAELIADQHMRLMGGDVFGAMASLLKRAQRYGSPAAYRDYLGTLHATGHAKDAWAGMNALLREGKGIPVLYSALVGYRIAGAADAEVVEWARKAEIRTAGEHLNAGAALLLEFATTDRIPSQDLSQVIQDLDQQVWRLWSGKRGVSRFLGSDRNVLAVGPDLAGKDTPTPGEGAASTRERVQSDLAYFAAGYRALKLKEYAAAKAIFDEAATLYDMTEHTVYMLPYYAYAAAKAGDVAAIEGILSKVKAAKQGPEHFLARAVLAGAAGRPDEALQALNLGRYRSMGRKTKPVRPDYVYGDISELVAELTGNAKIRDFALAYAKTHQKIEPWQAWPYAMEARLGRNLQDRRRAMAMAHYLDPKSERLATLKKAEIEQAVRVYGKANPFLQRPVEQGPGDKI